MLQGKESIAVDIATDEGREIVLELVRRADVVLQSFRAGVAERHGYTAADLLAVNPDLVYLNAPGYGVGPPCGHRPAYAPTIGAASGLAYRNVGGVDNVPQRADLDLESVKRYSLHMNSAAMGSLNADPLSAASVGTALALGLLARRRGAPGTGDAHVDAVDDGARALRRHGRVRGRARAGDARRTTSTACRRATACTARRTVGCSSPHPPTDDWHALAGALVLPDKLRDDDEALATVAHRPVRVASGRRVGARAHRARRRVRRGVDRSARRHSRSASSAESLGVVAETTHPTIGDYPRCTPMVRFSRSGGVAGPAPLCGQHTDAVLTELGYSADRIDALRAAGVLGSVP